MEKIEKTSKTKTTLLCCIITFLMALSISCFAQDTIITSNDTYILSRVIEVSDTEVRYKKENNPEGPLYIESKSTISKIKYRNGAVDSFPQLKPWFRPSANAAEITVQKKYPAFTRVGKRYWYGDKTLNEREMQDVLLSLNNLIITDKVKAAKDSRKGQYAGFLAFPFGMAGLIYLVQAQDFYSEGNRKTEYKKNGQAFLGLAAIAVGTSIYLKINRNRKNTESLRLYQQYY